MDTAHVLFLGFTGSLVFGIALAVYARMKWGRPARRPRHA